MCALGATRSWLTLAKMPKMDHLWWTIPGTYIPIWVCIFAIWELCRRVITLAALLLAYMPTFQPILGSEIH